MERKSILLEKKNLPNALIINKKPVIGLVGVPKPLFYSFGPNQSFLIENNNTKKLNVKN